MSHTTTAEPVAAAVVPSQAAPDTNAHHQHNSSSRDGSCSGNRSCAWNWAGGSNPLHDSVLTDKTAKMLYEEVFTLPASEQAYVFVVGMVGASKALALYFKIAHLGWNWCTALR